jgi:type II secretory pathway pseudopilin PulG
MKYNLPPRVVSARGVTLVELTVVIIVLLSLTTILYIGGREWKRLGDRSACIMNLRNFQVATRSYQNLYGYHFGGQPVLEYGTHDIARHLLEKGYVSQGLYDQSKGTKPCSGGGTYSTAAPDIFPFPGELYMNCSLSGAKKHAPDKVYDW